MCNVNVSVNPIQLESINQSGGDVNNFCSFSMYPCQAFALSQAAAIYHTNTPTHVYTHNVCVCDGESVPE